MSDGPASSLRGRLRSLASGVRFGKFASVGAVGAVCDNAVLTALNFLTELPVILAKAAGAETAILVMFLVNDRWTFAGEGRVGEGPFLLRLLRSHVVRAGGTAVQLLLFTGLYYGTDLTLVIEGVDFWFLAASVLAIGVAMTVNYVFESLFTWRVYRE